MTRIIRYETCAAEAEELRPDYLIRGDPLSMTEAGMKLRLSFFCLSLDIDSSLSRG